ncbi:MAG: hypothetical protein ABIR70_12765 [Bryobacteraceae bacterium]
MLGEIISRLKPEDEELVRKREELAAICATLVERELELVDFRSELAAFEGRYLREVGTLYAELDEWNARVAELEAGLHPSLEARVRAETAREQARQTHEDANSEASTTVGFAPSPELKGLFREVARRIHPDFSKDADDLSRRTRLMAEANRAYQAGDADALRRILEEYEDGADSITGEGIGAELVRIIRQISQARERVAQIERELAALRQSEIALLKKQAEDAQAVGRDLLVELSDVVRKKIEQTQQHAEALAQ